MRSTFCRLCTRNVLIIIFKVDNDRAALLAAFSVRSQQELDFESGFDVS